MQINTVYYNLEHGFVHNWLVAGPQAIAVDVGRFNGENIRQQVAQTYYEVDSGITETPVERGPLTEGLFQVGDYKGSWNYFACREDHFVEHSGSYPTPHYVRSWAFTQLDSKVAQDVLLVLTTHGPADVWLNDEHIHHQELFCEEQPESFSFKAVLKEGMNKLLIRFEMIAMEEFNYGMALQIAKFMDESDTIPVKPSVPSSNIKVVIPTLIEDISRRNNFEEAAAVTYISQDVFEMDDRIQLHWPADLKRSSPAVIRLMTPGGLIYAEGTVDGTAGDTLFLQYPRQIPEGPYRIFMLPRTWEYYDQNLRITREINLWNLGKGKYSGLHYGTYETRRSEALLFASQSTDLFGEIAKMALQQWTTIDTANVRKAMENANALEIVGLLGLLYRFGNHPEFPTDLLQPLEDCILNYPYHRDNPLQIADKASEGEHILMYAAEILAGQRYPENVFSQSGQTGQWHRQRAEVLTLDWLKQRGESGFSDWDSSPSFAEDLVALSHLVDLAEMDAVWEMSAIVMDKLFVTLAINSFQGVFGSTHGRASASHIKGSLLEPTSGISRLIWGLGIFNHHIAGPVSLACSEKYDFPAMISDIALFLPEESWSRECHAVNTTQVVNKVTYKTPDAMLCSAQDYQAGQRGAKEHIWQATLGHVASVFVTHPTCTSEDDSRRPNYWAGNAILPRVAQWKDALIAVYQLPNDDWMGFTHAYFPTYAFDESILRSGWAFARKGKGYLALTAAKGLKSVRDGHYTNRELRSYGQQNIWLCHVGRAALDGDFMSFQKKILSLDIKYTDTAVRFQTLRGEVLSFGWQGPFLRNDREEPLSGFGHYENPFVNSEYPSHQLEIRYGDDALRLEFGNTDS